MRLRSVAAGLPALPVALLLMAAVPHAANATIAGVFNGTESPLPCNTLQSGVRLCDEHAFLPQRPRSTVESFDGVPIDVRVAFPAAPAGGPDGPYPLIMLFHRYTGEKLPLSGLSSWLDDGYATFTMTERGFGESCGTRAARDADPSGCANGFVRMMDTRYEVRDAQELAGRLVDDGVVDLGRIGAAGNSYGGTKAIALAALRNRTMLQNGALVPWFSPGGTPISLAGAAASSGWTDLAASLVPNGSTLDYVEDARFRGRTGVLKQSPENALYGPGSAFYYPPPDSDPSGNITTWHALLNAGEPYDNPSGSPLPAVSAMRGEMAAYHSPYYIDDSVPPAPLWMASGWMDDLFPADESIRFYNRTRHRHLGVPISVFIGDLGHPRSQHKPADFSLSSARQVAWLDHYVKGAGAPPFQGVEMLTQTCPASAPSGGPYVAGSWAAAAPGEISFDFPGGATITPAAGSSSVSLAFDPYAGPGACATAPAADLTGTGTYRSQPVPAGGFTLLGSPTVVASIGSPGTNSQIAARLLDVDPSAGTEVMIARGLWRPAISSQPVSQVFQLHPNGYRFAPGHVVKLELLPKDNPYGRVSSGQADVQVSSLELRLPVLEAPGALDGLVEDAAPKVLPPGQVLARDFAPPAYARPIGATPLTVALVPAYRRCSAPNRAHGAPLSHPSCGPPVQASPNLTVGTGDSNGEDTRSFGSARFGVMQNDAGTPADETDVSLTVKITDVRRTRDLGDYRGELESVTSLRLTDRAGGPGGEPATMVDAPLRATLGCAATPAVDRGSSCSVVTTVDALLPEAVQDGMRAVWELGAIEVYDGGRDNTAATDDDNSLFARQGLFVP
jgi:predicted acyl esterase